MNEKTRLPIKERTYRFSLAIIKLVDSLPSSRATTIIIDQLLRSSMSIGANIVEAQAASTAKDFKNFLTHALKSANETGYWLALLQDSGKAARERVQPHLQEVNEVAKILGASIVTLSRRQ